MLYFKVYKSQLQVIERALETASLMLGSQKARGYCLEMICADFSGRRKSGRGGFGCFFRFSASADRVPSRS